MQVARNYIIRQNLHSSTPHRRLESSHASTRVRICLLCCIIIKPFNKSLKMSKIYFGVIKYIQSQLFFLEPYFTFHISYRHDFTNYANDQSCSYFKYIAS